MKLAGEREDVIERLQPPLLVRPSFDELLHQLGVEVLGLQPAEQLRRQGGFPNTRTTEKANA
jgi:hypothetical protein